MEVRKNADLRWIMSEDGVFHGAMSLKEPCLPLAHYVKSMFGSKKALLEIMFLLYLSMWISAPAGSTDLAWLVLCTDN